MHVIVISGADDFGKYAVMETVGPFHTKEAAIEILHENWYRQEDGLPVDTFTFTRVDFKKFRADIMPVTKDLTEHSPCYEQADDPVTRLGIGPGGKLVDLDNPDDES